MIREHFAYNVDPMWFCCLLPTFFFKKLHDQGINPQKPQNSDSNALEECGFYFIINISAAVTCQSFIKKTTLILVSLALLLEEQLISKLYAQTNQ